MTTTNTAAAAVLPRIVIVGGPGRGKSTLAAELSAALGAPLYCTDTPLTPALAVPAAGVTYLPAGLLWSEGSQYVADSWLTLPVPWIVEGIATVRAMRKLIASGRGAVLDGVRVLYLRDAITETTEGQERTAKAVATIWAEISPAFSIVSPRTTPGTPEELRYIGVSPVDVEMALQGESETNTAIAHGRVGQRERKGEVIFDVV